MKDYYQILEVPSDASQDKIKEQRNFLAHVWHPDKFPTPAQKAKANEKMKEINEAYETLNNPSKRAEYDRGRSGSSFEEKRRAEYERQQKERAEQEQQQRQKAEAERHRAEEEARQREQTEKERHRSNKDYYKTLQVDPSAEPEVITVAYKKLSLKYHPDLNKSPDATRLMQEINEAYETLNNPTKRAEYDRRRSGSSFEEKRRAEYERQQRERAEQEQQQRQKAEEDRRRKEEAEARQKEQVENQRRHSNYTPSSTVTPKLDFLKSVWERLIDWRSSLSYLSTIPTSFWGASFTSAILGGLAGWLSNRYEWSMIPDSEVGNFVIDLIRYIIYFTIPVSSYLITKRKSGAFLSLVVMLNLDPLLNGYWNYGFLVRSVITGGALSFFLKTPDSSSEELSELLVLNAGFNLLYDLVLSFLFIFFPQVLPRMVWFPIAEIGACLNITGAVLTFPLLVIMAKTLKQIRKDN